MSHDGKCLASRVISILFEGEEEQCVRDYGHKLDWGVRIVVLGARLALNDEHVGQRTGEVWTDE